MAAAPRRAWTTAIAAAIAVHGLLILLPVMDEREGSAATPQVVRLRLAATRSEPAAELPSAAPNPDPATERTTDSERAEPVARAHEPIAPAAAPLTTEPVDPIPPEPRRSEPWTPTPLPAGLIGEPPRAPIGKPAPAESAADALHAYAARVRQEVEAQKQYPRRARRMHRQGVAEIEVTLTRAGELSGPPSLARSSGWDSLDREAVRMVRAAAPFSPTPAGIAVPRITIRLPIRFFAD